MIINQAENPKQLCEQLAAIKIDIHAVHGRQRKKEVERWTACRLLAALAHTSQLSFSVSVQHEDRPDFRILTASGEVGLEATTAMSENYAECIVLRDKEFPGALINMGRFLWGTRKMTKDEMRAMLESGKLSGPPLRDGKLECNWASYICSCVDAKQLTLTKLEFRRYARNWLVIHDNLPLPSYSLMDGSELLMSMLKIRRSGPSMFDEIFIEHTDTILCITKNSVTRLPIPDLWGIRRRK